MESDLRRVNCSGTIRYSKHTPFPETALTYANLANLAAESASVENMDSTLLRHRRLLIIPSTDLSNNPPTIRRDKNKAKFPPHPQELN